MRPICTVCLLGTLATAAIGRAAEADLTEARGLLLGGKYEEAAEIYSPLAEREPAALLGLARCLAAQGRLDEAVKKLADAAEGHAELQAELARLAFERGDYQQARTRAEEAIRLDSDQLPAWWIRAEVET